MRMIECQWLAHALASDGAPNEVGSVGAAAQLDRGGIGERDIGDADRPATRISRGVAEGSQLFEIGVAARNRNVADAQSGAIFDAQSVRTSVAADAHYVRPNARYLRRTRDRKSRRTLSETGG